ncbi:MAG: DUF362 domain-containing protein [Candidatus Thorarchaeota archaeon]|jgi:uncharacterized protein (DUF362 family)
MAQGSQISVGLGRTLRKSLDTALSKMASPLSASKPVDRVVIKPSILDPSLPGNSSTEMIRSVVRVFSSVAPVLVTESDNPRRSAREAFSGIGLDNLPTEIARLVNLSTEDTAEVTMPGRAFTTRKMPSILIDSAFTVNLSTLKVNPARSSVSGSIKNLFGLLPEVEKDTYHLIFNNLLIHFLSSFQPDVTIMELSSVVIGTRMKGSSKRIGGVIVSTDPVAIDAFCASLFGIDPLEVSTIREAYNSGLGEALPGRIKVLGTDSQVSKLRDLCTVT